MRTRKTSTQKAARTTVSMPVFMFVRATELQQKRGLTNFSAYVQALIYQDQKSAETVKAAA
jgi:hypothetical protein